MTFTPQGIWVVGATFGAHYARALQGHGLRAIIGCGGKRGRQLAKTLACDYFAGLDQALGHSRPACAVVAVRSAIVGGEGDALARRLLQAGIPVLQELPLHPHDWVNTLRTAQHQGVRFAVTPFYDQMPTVRCFLRAARRLSLTSLLRSAEMRVSVQTLHCALFVLSDVLGAPSPSISTSPMAAPEKVLISSNWQGIAADIVLMNRFDAASPDDNAQPLMQVTLLSDEGELTLHSPFGQVIWERRLSPSDVADNNVVLTSPLSTMPVQQDMAAAIRMTLRRFMAADAHNGARQQRHLAVLQLWQTICARAGHPQQRRLPPPVAIGNLLGLTDKEDEL
ncbi:Gfo/Idh/MocA family oxidoreductase [Kosakonia sp. H02]|nr:Gfo/Idh/MocA family oxidoreductase [Kosakonia sp. H02]